MARTCPNRGKSVLPVRGKRLSRRKVPKPELAPKRARQQEARDEPYDGGASEGVIGCFSSDLSTRGLNCLAASCALLPCSRACALTATALTALNDVITREAFARNAIEPSVHGGLKIARAILSSVTADPAQRPRVITQ